MIESVAFPHFDGDKEKEAAGTAVSVPIGGSQEAAMTFCVVLPQPDANVEVEKGVYEGGVQIWEGSRDLVAFMARQRQEGVDWCADKVVMELGCGHGLPALFALQHGAKSCTFQDLNPAVLHNITAPNVALNVPSDASRCRFVSGDWPSLPRLFASEQLDACDVILSAETLYREEGFGDIAAVLKAGLKTGGVALFASKRYYFGVGGGSVLFSQYIASTCGSDLRVDSESVIEDQRSNVREILRIVRT
ncbi:unnamed protein product [Vitrella brassicaformis CCMP3155]|uniref:protein-histidine N-methyltransferase n=2 Tax=Vitrella brassicaformis TaxID=1169539 RepID=A0A0G4F7H8_VITBC|nr:unnamed protein product [Vitrella brassicaformis CCMP3155]|eukprot:CEM08685.1 unnamed protein product [Vitrella brassicaformis CCMP3155]